MSMVITQGRQDGRQAGRADSSRPRRSPTIGPIPLAKLHAGEVHRRGEGEGQRRQEGLHATRPRSRSGRLLDLAAAGPRAPSRGSGRRRGRPSAASSSARSLHGDRRRRRPCRGSPFPSGRRSGRRSGPGRLRGATTARWIGARPKVGSPTTEARPASSRAAATISPAPEVPLSVRTAIGRSQTERAGSAFKTCSVVPRSRHLGHHAALHEELGHLHALRQLAVAGAAQVEDELAARPRA